MDFSITLSDRGQRMTADSGIHALMMDLAQSGKPGVCMMGGGAPARIPEAEAVFAATFRQIAADWDLTKLVLGSYCSPHGADQFRETAAKFFRKECGWKIGPENIAVTGGGQSAFLQIFLLLGGIQKGQLRKILFPIAPEYIGYADQGMEEGMFAACRPVIRETGRRRFKYLIDFEAVERALASGGVAAMALSRPTNPSANVVTDEELDRLSFLAQNYQVPLVIDNAYGFPFPSVVFEDVTLPFHPHWILSVSFSKLGLPGIRCGVIIAEPHFVEAFATMTAISHLSPGNLGPTLAGQLLASGEVLRLSREVIKPFYKSRCDRALEFLDAALPENVDWSIHQPGGAFFLWLRLRDAQFSSRALYERLKRAGLIVVPGDYFFTGSDPYWEHRHECLRLSYCLPDADLERGVGILAEALRV